jgi:hypothetical protein
MTGCIAVAIFALLLGRQLGRLQERRAWLTAIERRGDALCTGVYRMPAPRAALHSDQDAIGALRPPRLFYLEDYALADPTGKRWLIEKLNNRESLAWA